MEDIDMSRPGSELFPETSNAQYNSYTDVNLDHAVDDPLDTGVKSRDVAGQEQNAQLSEKELNFRALREEAAKLQAEREYWKGQAEAYSRMPTRQPEVQSESVQSFDFEDSSDVKKAFDTLRSENDRLRNEMRDALAAVKTQTQHQDWNEMVSRHVPELTNKNPMFAEMIKNSSNPYEAAYLLAEMQARTAQMQQQGPAQHNAQRAINNAQKPQSLAAVGGHGTLSKADYYANMSDEDFMKIASRNLANI